VEKPALSIIDKILAHPLKITYFPDRGAYAPYVTCVATSLYHYCGNLFSGILNGPIHHCRRISKLTLIGVAQFGSGILKEVAVFGNEVLYGHWP